MQEPVAVILAGGLDFGRCPVATRLPRAFWPLLDRPLLAYQLAALGKLGVTRATICSGSRDHPKSAEIAAAAPTVEIRFASDKMPRGSAGCAKDAAGDGADGPVLVMEGGVFWVPDAGDVLGMHRRSGAQMTLFTTRPSRDEKDSQPYPAGVYVCNRSALDLVRDSGYQDLKEELLPALLKAGATVKSATVPGEVIAVRGRESYVLLVDRALSSPRKFGLDLGGLEQLQTGVWVAGDADVDPRSRLCGPVAVLEGASIGPDSVVVGPAVIGRRCRIEEGAILDASIIWDGAVLGGGSCVVESIVDEGGRVPAGKRVFRRAVGRKRSPATVGRPARAGKKPAAAAGVSQEGRRSAGARAAAVRSRLPREPAGNDKPEQARRLPTHGAVGARHAAARHLLKLLVVAAGLAWSYEAVFKDLWSVWQRNDNYSSGVLVPFLALYVIILRRRELIKVPARVCYWGLALVALGFAMRFAGLLLFYGSAERLSLIVVIVGLVVTLSGPRITRRLAGVLAFILLMLPLPNRVYYAVSLPLQEWATSSAVFLLELIGWFVVREGNVLRVGDSATVAVTEACSGLRMLMAFVIVSALVALIFNRPLWQKAILVMSSIPIAVACNTVRLAVTALAYTAGYGEYFNKLFHDFGGIAMMPLALAALAAELWVLKRMFIPAPTAPTGAAAD